MERSGKRVKKVWGRVLQLLRACPSVDGWKHPSNPRKQRCRTIKTLLKLLILCCQGLGTIQKRLGTTHATPGGVSQSRRPEIPFKCQDNEVQKHHNTVKTANTVLGRSGNESERSGDESRKSCGRVPALMAGNTLRVLEKRGAEPSKHLKQLILCCQGLGTNEKGLGTSHATSGGVSQCRWPKILGKSGTEASKHC